MRSRSSEALFESDSRFVMRSSSATTAFCGLLLAGLSRLLVEDLVVFNGEVNLLSSLRSGLAPDVDLS